MKKIKSLIRDRDGMGEVRPESYKRSSRIKIYNFLWISKIIATKNFYEVLRQVSYLPVYFEDNESKAFLIK